MKMIDNNSDCNNFSQENKNYLLIASSGTGMFSLIMCLIAVSLVLCWKLYKYFTYRLAMYQILSSLCVSVVEVSSLIFINYDGNRRQQIVCKIVSFFLQYFAWIKLLFTMCLVFHLFCLVVCLKNFWKFEKGYVLFSILFPLLFSWIPFIHNSYGVGGAWCWIRDWKGDCATQNYLEGIIEQFVLWYGPLFISLSLTVVAVLIILIVLAWRAHKYKNQENECLIENKDRYQNKKAIKELLPLLAYPVIFYLLILFPLINRIYNAISPNVSFELALAYTICEGSWSFLSSWALIIHILVARCLKKKKHVQFKEHPGSIQVLVDNRDVTYTPYTEGSTNARTMYSIPPESDVDNE